MLATTINTNEFTFNADTRSYAANNSDFRGRDLGLRFTVVLDETGSTATAFYLGSEYDDNKNVIEWTYVLEGSGTRIHIYND